MMGQQTGDQSQLFYLFNLERRIPADHLLRRSLATVPKGQQASRQRRVRYPLYQRPAALMASNVCDGVISRRSDSNFDVRFAPEKQTFTGMTRTSTSGPTPDIEGAGGLSFLRDPRFIVSVASAISHRCRGKHQQSPTPEQWRQSCARA